MSDPIDRQAAIDHWRSIIDATDEGDRYNMGFDDGLEFCISDLSTMPSAEPERKTGRWIPVMNGRGGHCCNRCNGYAPSYMNGDEHLSDFCPNCGANMTE